MKQHSSAAPTLMVIGVISLVCLGLVMLSSASAATIGSAMGDADVHRLLRRQAAWMVIGVCACCVLAAVDYRRLRGFVWPAFLMALLLLAVCLTPGLGLERNGARRWIDLRVATIQPSEFAKLVTIAALAHWYARHERKAGTFWVGFLAPMTILALPIALIVVEVDLGATTLLATASIALMFVAGASPRFLGPLTIAAAVGITAFALLSPVRSERLFAFLDLEKHRNNAGYQQYQTLIAIGSGGVEGLGLGQGRQKMNYVPEAHNDFIFAVVGEELGLRATLLVVFLYLLLTCCAMLIAMAAPDRFGLLLGCGLGLLLALQALFNLGVTTALLPNKGLPLPFVSYGGSNLVACLASIGVLLSIHRQNLSARRAEFAAVLRVKVRGDGSGGVDRRRI